MNKAQLLEVIESLGDEKRDSDETIRKYRKCLIWIKSNMAAGITDADYTIQEIDFVLGDSE